MNEGEVFILSKVVRRDVKRRFESSRERSSQLVALAPHRRDRFRRRLARRHPQIAVALNDLIADGVALGQSRLRGAAAMPLRVEIPTVICTGQTSVGPHVSA